MSDTTSSDTFLDFPAFTNTTSTNASNALKFTQLHIDSQINKESLRERFLNFLNLTDNNGRKLASIVSIKKNRCNLKFYPTELKEVFIVMVHCPIDSVLIRLAKECSFPRGFPIIWKSDTNEIEYKGFYPKFSNDIIGQSVVKSKDFAGADNIIITKKYSGFLGQVMAFEYGGNYYWFATCKNTASGPMIDDLSEIVKPSITSELINTMITENIHFCGECMSIKDRTHGAASKGSHFVVTFVATGHTFKPNNTPSNQVKFMTWFTNKDKVNFCKKHNLLIDIYYNISGKDIIIEFMTKLNNNRNTMTNEQFDAIILETNDEVSNLHQMILGNCLEGLIIYVSRGDNTSIVKFKFPFYTFRTMFIRQTLSDHGTLIFPEYMDNLKKFMERWVVPGDSAEVIYRWCLKLIHQYDSNHIEYNRWIRGLGSIDSGNAPMEHIFQADRIPFPTSTSMTTEEMVAGIKYKLETMPVVHVIVIIGPIGYGKSLRGRQLEEYKSSGNKFVHIDGDILNLESMDEVLRLGQERNGLTKYLICQAIMDGKIPVLSCGGGVIMNRSKIGLFNELQKVFSCVIPTNIFHLHVFHPTNPQVYTDHIKLQSVLTHRGWDNMKMYQKICCNNMSILKNIRKNYKNADNVTMYPYPSWNKEYFFPDHIISLENPVINNFPVYYQHRVLADYGGEKMGHVTVDYNLRGVSINDLSMCKGLVYGSLITFGSSPNLSKVIILKHDKFGEELNSRSHITVNPGKHKAVDMKTFTIGYNNGLDIIHIGNDKYRMDSLIIEPVEVVLHGDFYMLY